MTDWERTKVVATNGHHLYCHPSQACDRLLADFDLNGAFLTSRDSGRTADQLSCSVPPTIKEHGLFCAASPTMSQSREDRDRQATNQLILPANVENPGVCKHTADDHFLSNMEERNGKGRQAQQGRKSGVMFLLCLSGSLHLPYPSL